MKVSFSEATLNSLLKFTNAVVAESRLSTEVKEQVTMFSIGLKAKLTTDNSSSFHRSFVVDDTRHIEVDEGKLQAMFEVFMRHRTFFLGLFNIMATAVMSVLTLREMVRTAPIKLGLLGENLVDDMNKIRSRSASWDDQTHPLSGGQGENFHLRQIFGKAAVG
jgi:hypothetical protein